MPSKQALVRRPGPRIAEGLVTHIDRRPVDPALALRQWEAYVQVLRDHGWQTTEVDPADDCPDAVFVEDTMVVFRNVALHRPPRRRPPQARGRRRPRGRRARSAAPSTRSGRPAPWTAAMS